MRYVPSDTTPPRRLELTPEQLKADTRHRVRERVAEQSRKWRDLLWAIDDAEAQVRWGKADKFLPETLVTLDKRVTAAYHNAAIQAGVLGDV